MPSKIKITLRRSPIGYEQSQRDTARSLGLRKMQQSVVQNDDAVIRGMVHKIRHMVEVEPLTEEKSE
ncbi:MAG TPA: 50S ribosomal protein L30 [Chthonomonadaceae bacterium]|nr:50S ribosomal protein L30 [Chthonomonadaceae bacterium]